MKQILLTYFALLISTICFSQDGYQIETSDIDNFWLAYDSLENAKTKSDSIRIIQELYVDKASNEFKEFIRIRNFTSEEYVRKIGLYPNFWKTIRVKTEEIKNRKPEITETLKIFEQELHGFKKPKVCFAIGCLRTGGTTSENLILIGSEIAAADNSVNISELPSWLKNVMGKTGDITAMVAHETIHTQQINKRKYDLLTATLNEGIADFLTSTILNKTINQVAFEYGIKNECDLKNEFFNDLRSNKKDLSNWLYNGSKSKERPANLGYFIGFRIAQEYYENQNDKQKAVADLLNKRKYKQILKESMYIEKSCS